ncbi:polyphosphate polymerase domain-containing protein [Anaeromicropila populeti]|uniref:VTC domain-containing protein n=1 Tax=Anaeromicropila populeti TaxID=37658 RepID=A0A1I6L1T1_9FIRM|nr:polyphosphate polymerase domain-containing protein [Anaeromicropila populeti]SFR97406.1 VTC domain-containing protein [Anaeromicropila populeti]
MSQLKFRHETKHFITYSDYLAIRNRLDIIAERDPYARENNTYFIRSLYFDNYNDKALHEKLDGINNREKFRIRYYNGDTSIIHLEKKSKINGLCNKLSKSLTKEQVEKILQGDLSFMLEGNNPLLIDLYTKMKNQLLRPRVIVDYVREPFIYRPGNIRITFDTKIRSGLYSNDFFNVELPSINAQDSCDSILMEVKYDEFIPEVIVMCLQVNERSASAFSKYAAARRFG